MKEQLEKLTRKKRFKGVNIDELYAEITDIVKGNAPELLRHGVATIENIDYSAYVSKVLNHQPGQRRAGDFRIIKNEKQLGIAVHGKRLGYRNFLTLDVQQDEELRPYFEPVTVEEDKPSGIFFCPRDEFHFQRMIGKLAARNGLEDLFVTKNYTDLLHQLFDKTNRPSYDFACLYIENEADVAAAKSVYTMMERNSERLGIKVPDLYVFGRENPNIDDVTYIGRCSFDLSKLIKSYTKKEEVEVEELV